MQVGRLQNCGLHAHDQPQQGMFSCVLSSALVPGAVEAADMQDWWMINLRGQ